MGSGQSSTSVIRTTNCGTRWVTLATAVLILGLTAAPARAVCVGDCSNVNDVTVDNLLTMVNVALGNAPVTACTAGDKDGDGSITIDEILVAVNNALTGCVQPSATCGNGVPEPGEECDDGGTCIGGASAGTPCTLDSQCQGAGVCLGGSKAETACAADGDCPSSRCIHCKPFGGDGCAANCTHETQVLFNLVPGQSTGDQITAGTSGAVVHGESLTVALPLQGMQTLVIGRDRGDGLLPFVIPAASIQIPRIDVGLVACACVRGVALKTCGGTLFEADGSPSPSCTDGFGEATFCPSERPCAFVHGNGNSASGVVGCGSSGLDGVDFSLTQDGGGSAGRPRPIVTTASGHGPMGSVVVLNSTAIATALSPCSGSNPDVYGADGQFCTPDDPPAARGTPTTLSFTTGMSSAELRNANGVDDDTIGPFMVQGAPADCATLTTGTPSASQAALVGAFPARNQPTIRDTVVTNQLFAR